ncbi:MAG: outer membrane beta-barrel protein [Planctomycetota bacterium]|nr:outer membrane beta-barrel protein [Planctomycetota bacterium]
MATVCVLSPKAPAAEGPAPESPFAPKGLWIGKLGIFPSLSSTARYTDNALRTDGDRKSDLIHEHAPELRLTFNPSESVSASADYVFRFRDYVRDSYDDYTSHEASAALKVSRLGLEGLSLAAGEAYRRTSYSDVTENETIQAARFHENRASARIAYEYNRVLFGAGYSHTLRDYSSRRNSDADFQTHGAAVDAGLKWLPGRLDAFAEGRFERTLRKRLDDYDFDSWTALMGLRGDYGKLEFSAAVGYSWVRAVGDLAEDDDGLAFDVSAAYEPTSRMAFSLYAERRFSPSAFAPYTAETNVGAAAVLIPHERVTLSASVARHQSDRASRERLISWETRGRIEYRLSRHASISLGASRSDRRDEGGEDFVVHETWMTFRVAW